MNVNIFLETHQKDFFQKVYFSPFDFFSCDKYVSYVFYLYIYVYFFYKYIFVQLFQMFFTVNFEKFEKRIKSLLPIWSNNINKKILVFVKQKFTQTNVLAVSIRINKNIKKCFLESLEQFQQKYIFRNIYAVFNIFICFDVMKKNEIIFFILLFQRNFRNCFIIF